MGDEALRAWPDAIFVLMFDFAFGLGVEGVRMMLPSDVSVLLLLLSSLFGGLSVVLTALKRACNSDTVIRGLLLLLLLLLVEPLTLPFFLREWPFCMSGMVVFFFSSKGGGGERRKRVGGRLLKGG